MKPTKTRHPLRRIMIGVAATASGVVLLLALKQPGGTPVAGAPVAGAPVAGAPVGAGAGTGVSATAGADRSTAEPGGGAGVGAGAEEPAAGGSRTVVGDAVDTQYGPVQVRITVAGGKITKSEAVQAPGADARSQSVTADAVPQLDQAAVTAQNARIDAVSGASYTSQGYRDSLQSALDKAGV
ncbi:FMN-binding protein [Streptomyces scopuliridis]|uniref:FMN-binding protein n=1 Tax=Streptomyces scopuliridis TaxID=452529 RepID=A0ACD4ZRG6_9ACTN|nr:FMN-binding protein [Streptomyces scopuliridis]WSB36782.1 FMN-binding protein [Streptomyces scopuliridis]WSC01103.1 FMN-binding protein [Streptomyces scopuliridis]WSC05286.1 FMN-binding protein [Streptomyces scopuliridis]